MMELYVFGHNADRISQVPSDPAQHIYYNPTIRALCANEFHIAWSSWCDVVVAYRHDGVGQKYWLLKYLGTGLTESQRNILEQKQYMERAATWTRLPNVDFFGTKMHDGVRGYVIHDPASKTSHAICFPTELEMEGGALKHERHTPPPGMIITGIRMGSSGDALVSTASAKRHDERVHHFEKLADLWNMFGTLDMHESAKCVATFAPKEWCTNATTATALDEKGRVFTRTQDPRFPNCLGRPPNRNHPTDFCHVSYLADYNIAAIVSGGYMTAAITGWGRLFLWGQACPGSAGELSVLTGHTYDSQSEPRTTGIWAEGQQDDYIKCLTARVDGKEVQVLNVAIGHGHILVEADKMNSPERNGALFVAGDNSRGQLGLDPSKGYVSDFEELRQFRGKKIQELEASGWTSYIVAFGSSDWEE